MNRQQITQESKERAEKIAERDGGFLVPVYAVVKTDEKGRVQSVTHDHLKEVHVAFADGTSSCFLCKDVFHTCEGSSYRLTPKQKEKSGVVCADCAYNPDEKLSAYNQAHAKSGDRIYSFEKKVEYVVHAVDENGVYTDSEEFSYPMNPMEFKDFVIVV